jgi:hypothetical protein
MDIKEIIGGIVRETLPEVLRDLVREELGLAKTKVEGKGSLSLPMKKLRRPALATEHGVSVGQRWKAKSFTPFAGRVIEVASLGKEKLLPKIITSPNGKKSVAKPLSYATLTKKYDQVK